MSSPACNIALDRGIKGTVRITQAALMWAAVCFLNVDFVTLGK